MIKRIVKGVEVAMEENVELSNSFSENISNVYELLSDEISSRIPVSEFSDTDKIFDWIDEATDMVLDMFKQGGTCSHDLINEGVEYVLNKIEGIEKQSRYKDYYLHIKTDDIDKVKSVIKETDAEILHEELDAMTLAMIEEADRLYYTGLNRSDIPDNVHFNLSEILNQSIDEVLDDYLIKNSI